MSSTTRSINIILLVSVLLAHGAGCGDGDSMSCEELCQWAKDHSCSGFSADCAQSCQKAATLNQAARCTSQYSASLSCIGDHWDQLTCKNSTICQSEGYAYFACIMSYCKGSPMPPECS